MKAATAERMNERRKKFSVRVENGRETVNIAQNAKP